VKYFSVYAEYLLRDYMKIIAELICFDRSFGKSLLHKWRRNCI